MKYLNNEVNERVIFIESIIGCILFTIPIFMLSKNPIEGIHDYPPAIIAKVKELGMIDDTQVPGSKKVIVKKSLLVGVMVALITFVVG